MGRFEFLYRTDLPHRAARAAYCTKYKADKEVDPLQKSTIYTKGKLRPPSDRWYLS